MGRIVLTQRYLESGRLVAPLETAMWSGGQFRFVCPQGDETDTRICTLLSWMREEIAKVRDIADNFTFVGEREGRLIAA